MFKLAFNTLAVVDWLMSYINKKMCVFKASIIAELIVLYPLAKFIPSTIT